MKLFALLYKSLLSTADVAEKANLVSYYLDQINEEEKITSIQLMLNGKSGAVISVKSMTKLVLEKRHLSENLMKACYNACQDWVETCSLIVSNPLVETGNKSLTDLINKINIDNPDPTLFCPEIWKSVSPSETWLFNKIITGTLRPLLSAAQLSKIIAKKWNLDRELIHLRLCLYNLSQVTFKQLTDLNRKDDEMYFLPYVFTHPNEAHINLTLERQFDYNIQKFVYGERLLLIKKGQKLIAYNIKGEWVLPDPAIWHKHIPDLSQMEIVLSEDKTWIVQIPLWAGSKAGHSFIREWVNEFALSDQIDWLPEINIKDWNEIYGQGDIILKHKQEAGKWYRIKPDAHKLTAVLWYAEMPVTSNTMNMKLSFAIRSAQNELITICQLPSSEMAETDQTRLYYWIQNNTVQKFGPVRTVRTSQYFTLCYDRVRPNKRSKIGFQLLNAKIIDWLKDSAKVELSGIADIQI